MRRPSTPSLPGPLDSSRSSESHLLDHNLGVVVFARSVSLHLKPNSAAEFAQPPENEIIPLLRKQKGFQDEIAFIAPGEKEAVGISLWDHKEDAEAYRRGTYFE